VRGQTQTPTDLGTNVPSLPSRRGKAYNDDETEASESQQAKREETAVTRRNPREKFETNRYGSGPRFKMEVAARSLKEGGKVTESEKKERKEAEIA